MTVRSLLSAVVLATGLCISSAMADPVKVAPRPAISPVIQRVDLGVSVTSPAEFPNVHFRNISGSALPAGTRVYYERYNGDKKLRGSFTLTSDLAAGAEIVQQWAGKCTDLKAWTFAH